MSGPILRIKNIPVGRTSYFPALRTLECSDRQTINRIN